MANTLILYDGKLSSTERVANSLGMIIGNVCIAEISEAPEDISPYDGFCFIFNFYGALTAGKTRQYLTANREAMVGRRIALVGMGFSDNGFTKYVVDMEDAVGEGISITGMFISDENQVFESGFQVARMFRAPWNEMDPDELTNIIDEYIKAHTTLALATAGKGNVRCTPLEYNYKDGVFYIVTEGGLKFRSLLSNDDISAAIFEPYDGSMDHISGLQFSGKAVIVERGSDEYWEVLSQKHVTREACENLPVELFIVRIIPLRYEFLCSKFNEDGYDAKQFVNTKFAKQRWEDGVAFAKETVDHEAVARREMAEKAAAAEKAIEKNTRSISFTEIQEVKKPYDSSDIEALLKEAEEPSDEVDAEPAESPAKAEAEDRADLFPANEEAGDDTDDADETSDDFDELEDDLDDFDDDENDDFEYDFDDDFDEDDEDEFEDEPDDEFEDEYEEEPVREITKASGEIDIEELRRLMEEDENNESSGDYTFADEDDEYEDDEYEDDEYAEEEYVDEPDEYDEEEPEAESDVNDEEEPEAESVVNDEEEAVAESNEAKAESDESDDETVIPNDAGAAEIEETSEDSEPYAETEPLADSEPIEEEEAHPATDEEETGDEEDEDQPEAVLAYNVQDAIEKIRQNMAGVKAEQSENYTMPELEKTGEDMTEVVQDEDLTLDEDEIAEKYGNGPDLEGDFDMLDEENTYDLFETETDAEDTSKDSGSEETKADWEDAEKRVSSFRQIFSYRNELENDDAEAGQSGGSSDAFADEDEEFEKLFGFRNTSIYEDDETDLDSGRSYGRTRFDDDDDFEYDDEYSYDEDDDVLSDDELDELADDDEDVSEGGKKKGGFFSRNPFAGLAGLFGGKKKSEKDDYEDDEDAEYDDYEDDEDAEYDDYEDDEDAEYDDYEDDEDAEYDDYEDDEDAEYDDYEDDEDELPDFADNVKSSADSTAPDGKATEKEEEDFTEEGDSRAEYEVDEDDFTELISEEADEDDSLVDVKAPLEDGDDLTLDDEYEDDADFSEDDAYEEEDDFLEDDAYEEDADFSEDDAYEEDDDFLEDDEFDEEDDPVKVEKPGTARKTKRGGFFSGLGKSIGSLIGSSRRKDDDDDDLDDFDDDDEDEEMRGDVIDRLERNFENSVGRSDKYVVPTFDDSYDDLDSPEEAEEEEDDLLPYEDYDIPEISYTEAETEPGPAAYEDDEYEDDSEDAEYEDADDEYEDDYDDEDDSDIYDELEEDDSLSEPGIRRRGRIDESAGKSGSFISRLKAAFGGMKKQSRRDDEYEDDEYEDDEYEDDEYEDDEYEDDEYEDDEYEDDEYEDDEYEDDEYEDDEYEDEEYEDEPAPAKRPFGKIFMRKKPEKKVRGWNSEPVGKWNDEEEGVFDLDRDIDSVDISNLSDRLVAALDDDMIEEIHPDIDE